jgi:peptide-methionine (S)-S-oxide reductase
MGEFSSGSKGHVEVVEVQYDPSKIDYQKLLDVFWKNIDPTDPDGQFCDRGPQYRSAILYHDQQQKAEAEQSKQAIQQTLKENVVTPVIPAAEFKAAEENHQDYYKKSAFQYKQYKMRCGRDRRLRALWKY